MANRIPKDWTFIEELYRSGYSLRTICRKYIEAFPTEKLVPETVRKKAKLKGWKKDLEPAIKKAVERKLYEKTGETVATRDRDKPRSDEEIVEDAAEAQTNLILEHRTAGKNLRNLITSLQTELETSPTMTMLRKTKDGETTEIEVPVPLKDRIQATKDLSFALTKTVGIERISYNLEDRQSIGTGTIELVHQVPRAKPVPEGI